MIKNKSNLKVFWYSGFSFLNNYQSYNKARLHRHFVAGLLRSRNLRRYSPMSKVDKITFNDRFLLAILSAVTSFATGLVIWLLVNFAMGYGEPSPLIPFTLVIIFSCFMAALGFVTASNLVVNILGKIWGLTYEILTGSKKRP